MNSQNIKNPFIINGCNNVKSEVHHVHSGNCYNRTLVQVFNVWNYDKDRIVLTPLQCLQEIINLGWSY